MLGANAASTEATACVPRPSTSGRLRPKASESGPINSCPKARPPSIPVRVSCVADSETPRSAEMIGKAGRYMSIVSGPSAISAPRTRTSWRYRLPLGASTTA